MDPPWVFGANDPDVLGWATLAAYLVVAGMCFACGRMVRTGSECDRRSQWFWLAAALLLATLGINKELDLQTPIVNATRWVAVTGDWYAYRQVVRGLVLFGIAMSGSATATWLIRYGNIPRRQYLPVTGGFFLLLSYIVLRALPIEQLNPILAWDPVRICRKAYVLELAGIVCIGLVAANSLIRRQ